MSPVLEANVPTTLRPKLLDQLRELAHARGHSEASAAAFVKWSKEFILFHQIRHPREMGQSEICRFLEHVVRSAQPPLPALAECRRALEFLYGELLHMDVGELPWPRPPLLLDQVRQVLRVKHYSPRTEHSYVKWVLRYILFHHKRHPKDMGAVEVEQFLTDLAVRGRVSASTQNLALNALVFLYAQVLNMDLGRFDAVRARRGQRLPVVLTPEEVAQVLLQVTGADGLFQLMARLLYGCGLRVSECCRLRVGFCSPLPWRERGRG
jgi:hypothetical protein